MKRVLFYLLLLSSTCTSVHAQEPAAKSSKGLDSYMESGMEVEGIQAPYYDDKGNLKALLYGDFAKVLADGVADITNLRIDVYQDGEIMMTVFAPQCFSRMIEPDGSAGKKVLSVYSEGDVLIELESMSIVGRGFDFSSDDSRFTIHHDSKVLVKKAALGKGGLEL